MHPLCIFIQKGESAMYPKSNHHKRLFREDKFGRRYYCKHTRLAMVRSEKKIGRICVRKTARKQIEEGIEE